MKKTLRKRLCCAVLAMLLIAALCGCSMLKNTKEALESSKQEMDELLLQLMTCVENHDEEGAKALFYDNGGNAWDFDGVANYWPVHSTDSYEQRDLNYTKNISGKETQTITSAVYCVHSGSEDYQVTLVKQSDNNGSGIISFNVASVQELLDAGIEPVGSAIPAASKTLGQWCFLGFWVLMLVFALLTIVDIIRKKPKIYGLWILLALVFAGLSFTVGPNGIQLRFIFSLLQKSQWVKTLNGTNTLSLSLPLGAIIYWAMRKTLLKKKETHVFAIPAEESTTEVPPQDFTNEQ